MGVTSLVAVEGQGRFQPVLRPRVIERLARAAAYPVTVVAAPAGYGKTTALRQYLGFVNHPQVRYDMRASDSTLLGFIRGLAAAFAPFAPDLPATVSSAYDGSRASADRVRDLAQWMYAHIEDFAGLVVVDDFHHAGEDPHVCEFLAALIERTKTRIRWLIASRTLPALPVASWMAYGDMEVVLDERDLRFTADEAREMAAELSCQVSEGEIEQLLALTDAWATALSFALRSATHSADLRTVASDTREMVYRYLAEQVYKSLTEQEREFLHFIAYLPEIDLHVLRSAGYDNAKALLESLRLRVAFIYTDGDNAYRCHDLFRDFLRHQMERGSSPDAKNTQLRVAESLQGEGHYAAAIEIYINIAAEKQLFEVLAPHGINLLEQGHGDLVSRATEVLPRSMRDSAYILAVRARCASGLGRLDRAEKLLESALRQSTDEDFASAVAVELLILRLNQGRFEGLEILERLTDATLGVDRLAECIAVLAIGYAYSSREADAKRAIDQALDCARRVEDERVAAKVWFRIGCAAMHLHLAEPLVWELLNRARSLAEGCGLLALASFTLSGLANSALFYADDAGRSLELARLARINAIKAGDRVGEQTATLQILAIESKRGNDVAVQTLLQDLEHNSTSDASRTSYAAVSRAMASAWNGDFQNALRIVSCHRDSSFYPFDRAINSALHALYLAATKQTDAASAIGTQVLSDIAAAPPSPWIYGRRLTAVAICIVSVTFALMGQTSRAKRSLGLRYADASADVEAVRDVSRRITRAMTLQAPLPENDQVGIFAYSGFTRILLMAARHVLGDATAPDHDRLTNTELLVLRELADGRSTKEIAHDTGRSVHTVRTLVQRAIHKLGCSGRHQALAVARNRGLLG